MTQIPFTSVSHLVRFFMHKISLFILGLTAMSLTACSQDKAPVVAGTDLPADAEGQYAYIIDGYDVLDSVVIRDRAFEYRMPAGSPVKFYAVRVGDKMAGFFSEPGTSTFSPDSLGLSYDDKSTYLNRQITELNNGMTVIYNNFLVQITHLQNEMEKSGGMSKDLARYGMTLVEDFHKQTRDIVRKYFFANKDNPFAYHALHLYPKDDPKGFVELYEATGSSYAKDNPYLKNLYEVQKKEVQTSAGNPFTDVTMTDNEGKSAKVSDFKKEGRYLLIDVWASWCGPCRSAMPHLAQIAKDHAATLDVLSIGGLDETPEDNARARKELHMTWDTFFDADTAFVNAYSINGIPTLILIDPEGTILVKTNSPDEVSNKIEELGI